VHLLSDVLFTLHLLQPVTGSLKRGVVCWEFLTSSFRIQTHSIQEILSMNSNQAKSRHTSLKLLALTGLLAVSSVATADEVLVYKVSASRKWQQNTAMNPGQSTETGRRQIAGVARDTSYLILNRTSKEVVRIEYYTRISDGARLREFAVHQETYADWTGVFPGDEWEALSVAAPGGRTSLSLKSGKQESISGDFNGDGETDAIDEGFLSYVVGVAATRKFKDVILPDVASKMTGMKRQNIEAVYGPALDIIENKFPLARVYYRGAGKQNAVLDAKTTTTLLNTPPPPASGETIATTGYALFLVKQLLEKAGFEDAVGGVLN